MPGNCCSWPFRTSLNRHAGPHPERPPGIWVKLSGMCRKRAGNSNRHHRVEKEEKVRETVFRDIELFLLKDINQSTFLVIISADDPKSLWRYI